MLVFFFQLRAPGGDVASSAQGTIRIPAIFYIPMFSPGDRSPFLPITHKPLLSSFRSPSMKTLTVGTGSRWPLTTTGPYEGSQRFDGNPRTHLWVQVSHSVTTTVCVVHQQQNKARVFVTQSDGGAD